MDNEAEIGQDEEVVLNLEIYSDLSFRKSRRIYLVQSLLKKTR